MPGLIDFETQQTDDKTQRKALQAQRKEELTKSTATNAAKDWRRRVAKQGPWDPAGDATFSLDGAPSQPMPVQISDTEDFLPFFAHLKGNGQHVLSSALAANPGDQPQIDCSISTSTEPYYHTPFLEFPRGVLYADQRMDLCKQVLGPASLPPLMDSLDSNDFVRHFLFGNNIIGPKASQRLAQFIEQHPNQMETWYLAGNCIDAASFSILVEALVKSPAVANVWLKRNPLGPDAVDDIFKLVTQTPNLRTLDLDQTSLGDKGVAKLFSLLADHCNKHAIALRHIYLNANGVGVSAATAISRFLSASHSQLQSLYLSNNPLGCTGVSALSNGLAQNESLQRLTLQSVGMTDDGAKALLDAVSYNRTIQALDFGTSFATEDLGSRYNWLTDAIAPSVHHLIWSSRSLLYLNLGYTQLSQTTLNTIVEAIANGSGPKLAWFSAKAEPPSADGHQARATARANIEAGRLQKLLHVQLADNVRRVYGDDMTYDAWVAEEKRFVLSPRDVRYIDSVYRNRDAGMARRGLMQLNKRWDEDDDTLETVRNAA